MVTIPGPEEAKWRKRPLIAVGILLCINIPGPYEKALPSISLHRAARSRLVAKGKGRVRAGRGQSAVHFRARSLARTLPAVSPCKPLSPSKLGQLFVGYAFAEGWAHYTEEMMWDAGLGNNEPEMHIGQLLEALLRNVRFVSAIEMHTGKMTVAESEKMFLEAGLPGCGNARQQAARGTFDPAYLNYTMGKLMIRKLREDWTATRGGKQAWQAFHDEFLKYGGPPIPLVRKAMLGQAQGSLFE